MRRFMLCGVVLALVTGGIGCGFAQGFRDEGARQLAEITVSELEGKLDGQFKKAVKGVTDQLPKREPVGDGLLYSAGALLAYVIGSYGKGKLREAKARKSA